MIWEFDVSIRLEAEDCEEARDKFADWLAAPHDVYSIGVMPEARLGRDVTAEEQAA